MKEALTNVFSVSWPALCIILAIIIIIRIAYLKSKKKKIVIHEEIFFLFFVAYILTLFELVTYEDVSTYGTNLMPFREILRYDFGTDNFYKQVVGNILLFVPFGYFVTYYVKITKIKIIFFMTTLISVIIETVQYFIGRTFDIDDIILNVAGGIIGFLLYIAIDAIKKHLPKIFQKDALYSILSIALVIFIVLYFLKMYNIWGF